MGSFKRVTLLARAVAGAMALLPVATIAGSFDSNTGLCYGNGSTIGSALNAVETAIGAGKFTNARDQLNLQSKLNVANSKTMVRKWDDAIQKLQDISDAATALENATKPKLVDPNEAIHRSVLAAQACLTGL